MVLATELRAAQAALGLLIYQLLPVALIVPDTLCGHCSCLAVNEGLRLGECPDAEQTLLNDRLHASAYKVVYLAIMDESKKWTMPIRNWKPALNRFTIEFGERVTAYL